MLFQCFLVRVLQLVLWARSTLSSGCVQTLNCRQMRVASVDTKRALINSTKIKSVGRSPRSHTRTCCPNTVCSRVVVWRGDMNTSTHQTLRTLHCRGLTSTPVTQESPVTVKSVSFTCLRDVLTVSKIRSFSEQYKNLRWDLPRRASPSWVHLVPFACLQGAGWPWPWRSSLVVSNLHMRPTILRNGKRAPVAFWNPSVVEFWPPDPKSKGITLSTQHFCYTVSCSGSPQPIGDPVSIVPHCVTLSLGGVRALEGGPGSVFHYS